MKNIIEARNYCSKKNIKFYLSRNFKLAIKLNLDGAYIPSFYKNYSHLNYKLKSSFLIMGSAHNIKEIRIKETQKAKLIFISSIFKKNKNFLGLYRFRKLSNLTKNKIVALGGFSSSNVKKFKLLDCYGLSGISYFEQKKRPHKLGPFY